MYEPSYALLSFPARTWSTLGDSKGGSTLRVCAESGASEQDPMELGSNTRHMYKPLAFKKSTVQLGSFPGPRINSLSASTGTASTQVSFLYVTPQGHEPRFLGEHPVPGLKWECKEA